jgi:hypothetical protein
LDRILNAPASIGRHAKAVRHAATVVGSATYHGLGARRHAALT